MYRNLSPSGLGISGSQSEIIELTLSHGFRGMDLDLDEFLTRVQANGVQKARRLIDSARVKLGCCRLPVSLAANEHEFQSQLAALGPTVELIGQLGSVRLVAWIEPGSDTQPYHSNFEAHRQRLAALGGLLAQHQLSLAVGFLAAGELRRGKAFEFIHDLDQLIVLLSTVNAANVGLLVDTWEMAVAGSKLELLSKVPAAKLIAAVISDLPAEVDPSSAGPAQRRLPGESGTIDNVAAVVRLAELGFDGPLTCHADRAAFGTASRDAIVRLARERLDQVWKGAGLGPSGKLSASLTG